MHACFYVTMENIQIFMPIAFAILILTLALLSSLFYFRLRRAKQKKREITHKAEQDIAKIKEDLETRLAEVQAEAERKAHAVQTEHSRALERYASIIDLEAEVERLNALGQSQVDEAKSRVLTLNGEALAEQENIRKLREDYKQKRSTYDRLKSELAIFDERLALAELGVYEPHFDFGDSEAFKNAIKGVRDSQKDMVKRKTAVFGTKVWTVDGSVKKGETMINRAVRITLRAFNNECEAAIANTRWNNVQAMEKRIIRARDAIDKLNASNNVIISNNYLQAKLRELRLTHEYREQLKIERDERAEVSRLQREEKRLLQETKAAQKEEERYQQLLEKARAELGVVTSAAHQAKVEELEQLLIEAHAKTERAQAMAEKTKSGFVYVISNIGSFGENVIKIGLTRRLDPSDRVRELGDASVPFLFDTHAMIYSEEAPALEAALHSEFAEQRINAANMRKEFFRVTLSEVKEAVQRLAPNAEFHTNIEAQEFYETLAKRKELAKQLAENDARELPTEI
ncbi:T5orf172 domain-containing protein [Shimia marina]|uniref:T5orf172 domain protein n=2 Tax=Shimia marina TaxID=321267 RepID=A0A0P1ESZ6_9RHOB|nr:T5orf172 domain protein [Shimia marina]SFD83825.1 T5orf172 domain-containing protein [Shimia marina]